MLAATEPGPGTVHDQQSEQRGEAISARERERGQCWTSALYEELRRQASKWFRGEAPGHTLQPTAIVHEAFLRLAASGTLAAGDELSFRALAATAMRHVLVDHARRKRRLKRGGGRRLQTLLDYPASENTGAIDLLELDETLERLAALNPRHARIVELRFFGGLTVPEVAVQLGVGRATVENDWRLTRAWLARQLESSDRA